MTLQVWGRASSSNVQAVMWMIAELGLDVLRHDVGHSYGGLDTPTFLAMNPHGLIPVLRDGDDPPIWESGAILRYLAARYGPEEAWPEDPAARAAIDMWAEWAKVAVQRAFTVPIFWGVVRTAPSQQDHARISRDLALLHHELAKADARLADRSFIAANCLTLADIHLGHILYRYFDIEIERVDLPNLRAYYERLTARPAYRDHVMVDYSMLRVTD